MSLKNIPVVGIGPGSQSREQDALDYLPIPQYMDSYRTPQLPEEISLEDCGGAFQVLAELNDCLHDYRVGSAARRIVLSDLGDNDREMIDQVLGEGEVSVLIEGAQPYRIQESILPGVWRVQEPGPDGAVIHDVIELCDVPEEVFYALDGGVPQDTGPALADRSEGLQNAPALLVEVLDRAGRYVDGEPAHVINLTLLPVTPEDLDHLEHALGVGPVTILSRGFGNCRITSTGVRNAWWVRYYNSMDTMILNTLEVVRVPSVACAAQEDIDDNAERLSEIMEIF